MTRKYQSLDQFGAQRVFLYDSQQIRDGYFTARASANKTMIGQ